MKRFIAIALVVVVALFAGPSPISEATSAVPQAPTTVNHTVPQSQSHDICIWWRNALGYGGSFLGEWRTIHFGTDHITQCGLRHSITGQWYCFQWLWEYNLIQFYAPDNSYPVCWI